ncbi:SOS response-associated peptidase [Roseiconus nitratireducens]|uniref:SOS response-associated peptidase n=1 Tax=Roseiconus nitratireducens TaxID=2605748 RepID=UPI001375AC66|nr:SOS response-associated peptidase [Roseiconus nitratireducens]
MCGRFTLRTPAAAWAQEFLPLWSEEEIAAAATEYAIAARYNIAPTQSISVIHTEAGASAGSRRQWSLFRWGLVPPWADDLAIGNRMINARSETVHEKNSFRKAFVQRRCLIPADGYFEWMKTPDGKQPYLIERASGGMLAMAGLWEQNKRVSSSGHAIRTCTILTTAANETTATIHDRMPVLLEGDQRDAWLDPQQDDPTALRRLLQPASNDLLKYAPVSRLVNRPGNDSPECVQVIDAPQPSPEKPPPKKPSRKPPTKKTPPTAGDGSQATLFD